MKTHTHTTTLVYLLSICRQVPTSFKTNPLNIIFDDFDICLFGYRTDFTWLYLSQRHNIIRTQWYEVQMNMSFFNVSIFKVSEEHRYFLGDFWVLNIVSTVTNYSVYRTPHVLLYLIVRITVKLMIVYTCDRWTQWVNLKYGQLIHDLSWNWSEYVVCIIKATHSV